MEYELKALQDKVRELERQLDSLGYDVRRLQEGYLSNSHNITRMNDKVRELELMYDFGKTRQEE